MSETIIQKMMSLSENSTSLWCKSVNRSFRVERNEREDRSFERDCTAGAETNLTDRPKNNPRSQTAVKNNCHELSSGRVSSAGSL